MKHIVEVLLYNSRVQQEVYLQYRGTMVPLYSKL